MAFLISYSAAAERREEKEKKKRGEKNLVLRTLDRGYNNKRIDIRTHE